MTHEEGFELLRRDLSGRVPVFWHEPYLEPNTITWDVAMLPNVLVGSRAFEAIRRGFPEACRERTAEA